MQLTRQEKTIYNRTIREQQQNQAKKQSKKFRQKNLIKPYKNSYNTNKVRTNKTTVNN